MVTGKVTGYPAGKLQEARRWATALTVAICVVGLVVLSGCGGHAAASSQAETLREATATPVAGATPDKAPDKMPDTRPISPLAVPAAANMPAVDVEATESVLDAVPTDAVPTDAVDSGNANAPMQSSAVAAAVERVTQRTRMGFLSPRRVPPQARMTATINLPVLEAGVDAQGEIAEATVQADAQDEPASPTALERLVASAAALSAGVGGALPTPTPTPNPLSLAEWLAQPVPEPTSLPAPESAPPPTSLTPAVLEAPPPTPVWSQVRDGETRTVRVPILMYHYLSVPPPGADIYRVDLSVTPERFAAHLDALQANGYTTISLYQLHAHLTQGAPLPEKPILLTFDDGYRDNYENAFPLLRQRGMTATFFIVTDFINEGFPAYLTWDMVREMYAGGMSIEAHGRNHTSLKNRDIDYLVWQALGTLEAIEQEVGVRPRFIAYPAGQFDPLTIDIFTSANYWGGITTVQGATHTSERLFELRRVRIRHTTTVDELLRLAALDW